MYQRGIKSILNCPTCNENNWKAVYEKDVDEYDELGDIETIFLICHGCGDIWTAQIET